MSDVTLRRARPDDAEAFARMRSAAPGCTMSVRSCDGGTR